MANWLEADIELEFIIGEYTLFTGGGAPRAADAETLALAVELTLELEDVPLVVELMHLILAWVPLLSVYS